MPVRSGRLERSIEQALAASPARIVIAGAGGWLGMATLELLTAALGPDFAARIACYGSTRRDLRLIDGTVVEQSPLAEMAMLDPRPSLVLHLAFLTKDRAEAMAAEDYAAANRKLGATVLAALDSIGAEGVFVASSGAAARIDDPAAPSAMRLYGQLKRQDEQAFADWAKRHGKKAVIARIFNLSGPHINKHGSYALASFILDSLAGRPIAVRAPHPVVRSYVAVRELMSVVFARLLDDGAGVTRFDSGGVAMELAEVADIVARVVRKVPVERSARLVGPVDSYTGDGAAYQALLDQYGITPVDFPRQVAETAEFLTPFQPHAFANRVATGVEPC